MTWMGEGTADSYSAKYYAERLAYLDDASKIRARTLDAFGKAPSLRVCQRIVEARRARFARPRRETL